ncbi:ATP-binding protein [Streptomyces sp. NPDC057877]|uniref:ATP-binding protein n=1 Tax=Streptomyces sp. NPDC057877 TaxID=3346269 RepID=UPI0036B1737A
MTPRSIRLARLHTRRRLTMWRWPGDIDDAVLVTSELVANAVRHGRLPGHELHLGLRTGEGGEDLIVDVSDPILTFPTVDKEPGEDAEFGRGLLVVSQIAAELDWFLRQDAGKTVRARLAAEPPVPK